MFVVGGYGPAGAHPTALDASGAVDVDRPQVEAFDVASSGWSERAPLPRGLNHVGVASMGRTP